MRHLFHVEDIDRCGSNWPLVLAPLIFETWWDRRGHKKMTHNDNEPVPAGFTEKGLFLSLAKKCFFLPKINFFPQKTPKIC